MAKLQPFLLALSLLLALLNTAAADELPAGAIARLQSTAPDAALPAVLRIAFSPDGDRLASLHRDRKVRVWQWKTGRIEYVLDRHRAPVTALEFSDDGKRLLTAAYGPTEAICLWDAATGQLEQQLAKEFRGASAARFIEGGKLVAGLSAKGGGWFDPASGKCVKESVGEEGPAAISPDGQSVARLILDPMRIQIERIFDQDAISIMLSAGSKGPTTIEYSPFDGERLVIAKRGGPSCTVYRVYEHLGDVALDYTQLEGHAAEVAAAAFSPNNQWVATASADGSVRIFERLTMQSAALFHGGQGSATAAQFSPDGWRLAVGGSDGSTLIWELHQALLQMKPSNLAATAEDLEQWWQTLGAENPQLALQGVSGFASHTAESLPFLDEKFADLRPRVSEREIRQMVSNLDSDLYVTRQAATTDLTLLRPGADPMMRRELKITESLEPRARLMQILDAAMPQADLSETQLRRRLRVVLTLEAIAPLSRTLLTRIAEAHPHGVVANAASAALTRRVLSTD